MNRIGRAVGTTAVALAMLVPLQAPVLAEEETPEPPFASGLSFPLGLAVHEDAVYVTQNPGGDPESEVPPPPSVVTKIVGGVQQTVASTPMGFLTGVDATDGNVVFTGGLFGGEGPPLAGLFRPGTDGAPELVADLGIHEAAVNPDVVNTYGYYGKNPGCLPATKKALGLRPQYRGENDNANPYAVAAHPDGGWLVADAGGNSLLRVTTDGGVSTAAVLPVQVAQLSSLTKVAACRGASYGFESVPTDVEIANGFAYVSVLPGGPEDPSTAVPAKVYRIPLDAADLLVNDQDHLFAQGFTTATDLAVAGNDVYVAELMGGLGGRISTAASLGTPTTFLDLPLPSAVEIVDGTLYATGGLFFGDGGAFITTAPVL